MALLDDEDSPSLFGVKNQRTGDPVTPPPIDRQRIYQGTGGDIGMGAKPRAKATGGVTVNKARPGAFAVRQRTLRKG
jgi:hypothetical protein